MERPMEGMTPGMPPMDDEPMGGDERSAPSRPAKRRAAAKPRRKVKAKAKSRGARRASSAKRRGTGRAKAKARRAGGKRKRK